MLAQATAKPKNDQAYAEWSEIQHATETMTFDQWLNTPEGMAWLDEEEKSSRFQRNGYHDMEPFDFEAIGE